MEEQEIKAKIHKGALQSTLDILMQGEARHERNLMLLEIVGWLLFVLILSYLTSEIFWEYNYTYRGLELTYEIKLKVFYVGIVLGILFPLVFYLVYARLPFQHFRNINKRDKTLVI